MQIFFFLIFEMSIYCLIKIGMEFQILAPMYLIDLWVLKNGIAN